MPLRTVVPVAFVIDSTLSVGAVTSPWWIGPLHSVNELAATIAAVGGAIVMLIRLYLVLRDVSKSKSRLDDEK